MQVNRSKLLFKNIFRLAASATICIGVGLKVGIKYGFKQGMFRWRSRKHKAFRNGRGQGILNAMRDNGQI